MWIIRTLVMTLALILIAPQTHAAPDDADALSGIKQGRVVWDINMGSANKMALYLKVIRQTYDDLVRQGVEPEMIFAFRGLSVKVLSTTPDALPMDQQLDQEEVWEILKEMMSRKGVRMEACNVATSLFGVDNGSLLKGVKAVGNTFVSLIGYQSKGFAAIPIY
ncbi:DsrE family protein [Magnetococcus sp. PR-3]|uniref:DsrE family protein n=1 Tax=Magnetococcus sp. PR-3 TaxID=3120355 RepID=UPI002FCE2C18